MQRILETAALLLLFVFVYIAQVRLILRTKSGKGSNYGTFMDYDEKLESFSPQKTDSTKPPSLKNLSVNPPQKGSGYGYPNLTIGKYPPYFLDGEYEELKNTPIEPKKPKDRTFQAYRAGLYQQGYFHPNPYGADELCLEPKEDVEAGEKAKTTIKTAFIPSNPPKKDGGMKAGCLDPFPSHTGELYPRIELIPRGIKRYINDKNQMFRPVPGIRPYPVKSIINKNVQKKVNPKNFSTVKGVVYCKNK